MSTPGYFATGPCCLCGAVFVFNPELVPAIPVDEEGHVTPEGVKKPLCQGCVKSINEFREFMGSEPIQVLPGAYDAAEGFPP